MLKLADIKTMTPAERKAERDELIKSLAPQLARLWGLADGSGIGTAYRVQVSSDLTVPFVEVLTISSVPEPGNGPSPNGHRLDFQLGL